MDIEELIGNLHELLSLAEDGILYREHRAKAEAEDEKFAATNPKATTADGRALISGDVKDNTAPAPGRRRRASSPPSTPPTNSLADQGKSNAQAVEAPSGRRRRGSALAAAPATKSGTDDKITDADLLKAASAAAQKITPDGVKDVVRQYARNGQLNDIPADNRREFLNELKVKVSLS